MAVHEYPAGHILLPAPEPVAEVLPYGSIDPGGHIYPTAQGPVHAAEVSPDVEPYVPVHGVHDPDPGVEYVPGPHIRVVLGPIPVPISGAGQ